MAKLIVLLVLAAASLFALATLSIITCTAETPQSTGSAEQAVINPPLPSNLNLILHARTTVTAMFTSRRGRIGTLGKVGGSMTRGISGSANCRI